MLTLVLGGPGCGKTTALLKIIDDLLAEGIPPAKIGYLTFTRKAAHEGLQRAADKFKLDKDEFPYFSTIHSFAFNQLGLAPTEVMSNANYVEFGSFIGLEVTKGPTQDDSGFMFKNSRKSGEKALSMISMARITQTPLRHMCEESMVDFHEVEWVRKSLEVFKRSRGLMDFTDILEIWYNKGAAPKLSALIVDEAQDLSALQWRIIEKLAKNTERQYIAGDDDQAIFQWAGADVDYFLNLKGTKVVLPTSYRLKRNIFNVCQSVVANISKRFAKEWQPHAEGGSVTRINKLEHVEIQDGTWLMLARNQYLLNGLKEHLTFQGYPFIYDGNKSTVDNDRVRSLVAWELLRAGKAISGAQAKMVYQNMHKQFRTIAKPALDDNDEVTIEQLVAEHGLQTRENWMKTLRMAEHEKEYYREIRMKGESLIKEPRITLSTIHGVKGGEADHVLLCSDMSYASYRQLVKEPSAESRVFYVGVSRSKQTLHLLNPLTPRFYPIGSAI